MIPLKFPKEHKDLIIRRIQEYFGDEGFGEIGNLASENLLDFMTREMGPIIYNYALGDARKLVGEKMLSLEDDLYSIEKPIKFDRR